MKLIPAGDLASAEPVMPVRWCLSRSEVQVLKERGAENIHVLFVIAYEGTDLEDRMLVPIDQVIAYLNFRRPGNHTVFALVVWASKRQRLNALFLSRVSSRHYENVVLNGERTGFRNRFFKEGEFTLEKFGESTDMEVVVSREHFPPEPSDWLKKMVNAGFEYAPVDQCSFRRRMLCSPIKLFFMGLWAVLVTLFRAFIAFVLVLWGARRINFEAVIHPWRDYTGDVSADTRSHRTWYTYDNMGRPRPYWVKFFHPIILLLLFGLLTLIKVQLQTTYWGLIVMGWTTLFEFGVATWKFLVGHSSIWVRLVLSSALFFAVRFCFRYFRGVSREKQLALQSAPGFKEMQQREKQRRYDDLYKLLACQRTPLVASVTALPPERQTLHLKYLALKAKVCRPFAAN